eukprot:6490812-Amphidinium_carterae.4
MGCSAGKKRGSLWMTLRVVGQQSTRRGRTCRCTSEDPWSHLHQDVTRDLSRGSTVSHLRPNGDEVRDARYKLRVKLIYLMHCEKLVRTCGPQIEPRDIWNLVEAACRLHAKVSHEAFGALTRQIILQWLPLNGKTVVLRLVALLLPTELLLQLIGSVYFTPCTFSNHKRRALVAEAEVLYEAGYFFAFSFSGGQFEEMTAATKRRNSFLLGSNEARYEGLWVRATS